MRAHERAVPGEQGARQHAPGRTASVAGIVMMSQRIVRACMATLLAGCVSAQQPAPAKPALLVDDTTQFEPTTWSVVVTGHADRTSKLTAPSLEVHTLHEGTWVLVGSMSVSADPARKALPAVIHCSFSVPTPIQLEAGREHRSLHELRDHAVIG